MRFREDLMKEEDIVRLLKALLDGESVEWREESGFIRFRLEHGGAVWETDCRACGESAVFYGRFPFRVSDAGRARRLCDELNRELLRGSLFLTEDGSPVFRCTAELADIYCAEKALVSALRYSAQAVTHYWGRLSVL